MEDSTTYAPHFSTADGEGIACTTLAGESNGAFAGNPGRRETASSNDAEANPAYQGGARSDIGITLTLDAVDALTNPLFGLVLKLTRMDLNLH